MNKTLAAAAFAALAIAAPAQAATVQVVPGKTSEGRGSEAEKDTVTYRALPGEVNQLTLTHSPNAVTVRDPAGLQPSAGCTRPVASDTTTARCAIRNEDPAAGGLPVYVFLDAGLGDGNDSASVPSLGRVPAELFSGDIEVVAIDGGGGDDKLTAATAATLAGAAGADTLRLNGRGGFCGAECKGVGTLTGGAGNDRLTGDRGKNTLKGGAGNDRLKGGAGKDSFSGDAGRDRIDARDRKREKVRCGKGRDRAVLDRRDKAVSCEKRIRSRR